MVTMRKITLLTLVLGLVLALSAPTAFAQSSTQRGYDESRVLGSIEGGGDDNTPAPRRERDLGGGELPFTGLDVLIVALMGAALLGTGVVIRRTARQNR